MRAWLRNAIEVILWWWVGRPTSKMREAEEARYASTPRAPRPGKTYY